MHIDQVSQRKIAGLGENVDGVAYFREKNGPFKQKLRNFIIGQALRVEVEFLSARYSRFQFLHLTRGKLEWLFV